MENMKLTPPWITYVHELEALFGEDPEIRIVHDGEANEVKLYVESATKADALSQLLPAEQTFGNVKLKVTVVPANLGAENPIALYEKAFAGNPVLSYVINRNTLIGSFNYVVFKNGVVQFFNDQLDDVNGNRSTLYQEIAKDVFGENNNAVFFCTDTQENIGAPLGEWP